mmetsp:Transcript_17338/g.29153  ORF Transcript_17338/g.29153 Transcript_17338/m.29153 type:complete len:112 (+) Transcript_17338:164-499(+)
MSINSHQSQYTEACSDLSAIKRAKQNPSGQKSHDSTFDKLEEEILTEFAEESKGNFEREEDILEEVAREQEGNQEAQRRFENMVKQENLKQQLDLDQIQEDNLDDDFSSTF